MFSQTLQEKWIRSKREEMKRISWFKNRSACCYGLNCVHLDSPNLMVLRSRAFGTILKFDIGFDGGPHDGLSSPSFLSYSPSSQSFSTTTKEKHEENTWFKSKNLFHRTQLATTFMLPISCLWQLFRTKSLVLWLLRPNDEILGSWLSSFLYLLCLKLFCSEVYKVNFLF